MSIEAGRRAGEWSAQPAGVQDVFVRRDYVGRYASLLERHLPPDFTAFAPFFADLGRLETMAGLLARHLRGTGRTILNAGCGPFASEIFVAAFQGQRVAAFDYTAEFAAFDDIFRSEGLLDGVTFRQADAMRIAYPPASFDLVVMHDLLYEEALDLDRLLARYRPWLKPDGLVYFDYMNSATRRLWRLLGKERAYRRYGRAEVWAILDRHCLDLVEEAPVAPGRRPLKALAHAVLTRLFGTSNAFAVVARARRAA